MNLVEGIEPRVAESYIAHLHLRQHINEIQSLISAPTQQNEQSDGERLREAKLVIDGARSMVLAPSSFAFQESDPPATDILAARLRALYWGAQVIMYQPFLQKMLEVRTRHVDPQDISTAREAIKALIESTRAFHGLDKNRLIIADVHSAAYA